MGFDIDLFVRQPVDANLVCSICQEIQENPTSCCTNGHTFCHVCIEMWTQSPQIGENCPDCREAMVHQKVLCRPLQSIIMALQVQCPNKDEDTASSKEETPPRRRLSRIKKRPRVMEEGEEFGRPSSCPSPRVKEEGEGFECVFVRPSSCPWVGTLEDYVNKHSCNECDYAKMECPHCNYSIKISEFKKHEDQLCLDRLLPCDLCGTKIKARRLKSHKMASCPDRLINCRYCEASMAAKDYGSLTVDRSTIPPTEDYNGHLKTCPRILVKCEFARHGCDAHIERKDLANHCEEMAVTHAQLLSEALKQMEEDKDWQKMELVWLFPHRQLRELRLHEFVKTRETTHGIFTFYLDMQLREVGVDTSPAVFIGICVVDQTRAPLIDNLSMQVQGRHSYESNHSASFSLSPGGETYSRYLCSFNPSSNNPRGSTTRLTLESLSRDLQYMDNIEIKVNFRLRQRPTIYMSCEEP